MRGGDGDRATTDGEREREWDWIDRERERRGVMDRERERDLDLEGERFRRRRESRSLDLDLDRSLDLDRERDLERLLPPDRRCGNLLLSLSRSKDSLPIFLPPLPRPRFPFPRFPNLGRSFDIFLTSSCGGNPPLLTSALPFDPTSFDPTTVSAGTSTRSGRPYCTHRSYPSNVMNGPLANVTTSCEK